MLARWICMILVEASVPRYHFNIRDGRSTPDVEGVELPDEAAARREAANFAGKILQDAAAEIWDDGSWMVDVTDNEGISQFAIVITAIRSPDPEGLPNETAAPQESA